MSWSSHKSFRVFEGDEELDVRSVSIYNEVCSEPYMTVEFQDGTSRDFKEHQYQMYHAKTAASTTIFIDGWPSMLHLGVVMSPSVLLYQLLSPGWKGY